MVNKMENLLRTVNIGRLAGHKEDSALSEKLVYHHRLQLDRMYLLEPFGTKQTSDLVSHIEER